MYNNQQITGTIPTQIGLLTGLTILYVELMVPTYGAIKFLKY